MDFHIVGSNRATSIKEAVAPVAGDKVLCDPGVNECSSFLLDCISNSLTPNGLFGRLDDIQKSVIFQDGLNSTQFSPGVVRRYAEVLESTSATEITVTHPPDQDNKRFVEVWKIQYPDQQLTPVVQSATPPVLVASDKYSLKPLIYPEVVQTLPIPVGTGNFLNSPWDGIQMYSEGAKVVIYSTLAVIILEWNGAGYDQTLIHQTGTVDKASVNNNSAIVTYNDGVTNKIAFYEKTTSWALSNTLNWSYPGRVVSLNGDYILVGGAKHAGITLNKSDLSVHYTASGTNYLAVIPTRDERYNADTYVTIGYTHAFTSGGGPSTQKLIHTEYYTSSDSFSVFSAYLPVGQVNVRFLGGIFLRHPYTADPYDGFVMKTSHSELFPYEHLYGDYSATLDINLPLNYSGYLIDKFLVGFYLPSGFGYKVLWAYGAQELIELYDYNSAIHKIYDGVFYPVKYPYYLTNTGDGNLKLLRIGTTHYNEIGNGVLTLKFEYADFINSTTGFSSGFNGIEICKFLISEDNLVYYKWSGSSWVQESDPSLGNIESEFTVGCAAGFYPSGSKVVYVKAFLSSNSTDNAPSLVKSSIQLSINYLSMSGKATLCDDSKAQITFEDANNTKISPLDEGKYAIAAVVTIYAPQIDTHLDI